MNSNITGHPLMTLLKRSLMVFSFWFIIVLMLCVVYNEILVSETMMRYTGANGDGDEDDELTEDELAAEEAGLPPRRRANYSRLQLEYHQIMSLATSVALVMLAARYLLELLCYSYGPETCSIVSGQTINATIVQTPAPVVAEQVPMDVVGSEQPRDERGGGGYERLSAYSEPAQQQQGYSAAPSYSSHTPSGVRRPPQQI